MPQRAGRPRYIRMCRPFAEFTRSETTGLRARPKRREGAGSQGRRYIRTFRLNTHHLRVNIPRQSRGFYDCWPLKGAGTGNRPLTRPRTSATLSPRRGLWSSWCARALFDYFPLPWGEGGPQGGG
jgi:hypothetical protein